MKAITLHQPWASLIACGAKRIETRSWPAPAVLSHGFFYGHRFAIHAGKVLIADHEGSDFNRRVAAHLGDDWATSIPRGAVVATAVLDRCEQMTKWNRHLWPDIESDEHEFGEYALGRWMWHLTEVMPVDPPMPARGYQGLWTWR